MYINQVKTINLIYAKNSFNYDELIACANGELFGEGNAKLPLPPMLMFDRITEIKRDIGEFKKDLLKLS